MNKKKSVIEDLFKSAFENHKKKNLEEAENLYKIYSMETQNLLNQIR